MNLKVNIAKGPNFPLSYPRDIPKLVSREEPQGLVRWGHATPVVRYWRHEELVVSLEGAGQSPWHQEEVKYQALVRAPVPHLRDQILFFI